MARKGANIFKRKDGRWEARFVKGRNLVGKIEYGFCYGKTYSEAREKQQKAVAQILLFHKQAKNKKNCRFVDYVNQWFEIRKLHLKESSVARYIEYINNQILPFFRDLTIEQISSSVVATFTRRICEEGLSAPTIKGTLGLLGSILKYIAKENCLFCPLAEIVYPKEVTKAPKVLSENERNRLLKFVLQDVDYGKLAIAISLCTGLRIGEVCGLKWGDLDFFNGTLSVERTVERIRDLKGENKTKIIISTPKTKTSARVIPMPRALISILKQQRPKNFNTDSFILTNANSPIEPRKLQYKIKTIFKKCGIEGGHFHTLRHTFTSMCGESHFEIKALSEILGHKTPSVTLERYMHPSLQAKKQNMTKFEMILQSLSSQNKQSKAENSQ